MRACGLENGCYALLEELVDCTERNAIEYVAINKYRRKRVYPQEERFY